MMKILILTGSYRKRGNTYRMAALVADYLQQEARQAAVPLEIETQHLGELEILPCRGCRTCLDRGEALCPQKDDISAIAAKMRQADGLLVATPVYVDDVSGLVKTWMDRLAYLCHRPGMAGKSLCLLATVGSSPTGHTLRTLQVLTTWGYHLAGQAGFKCGALLKEEDVTDELRPKAAKLARQFFCSVQREHPLRPAFLSLMTFRIQQIAWARCAAPDSPDYQYWSSKGWLNPKCEFYIPQRSGKIKVLAARLLGSIIAPFFT